jgi:hypothetical protein
VKAWKSLNKRQQTYLLEVFRRDQAQERAHEQSSSMSHYNNTPADVWRKIEYADTYSGYTPIKQALIDANLVDQGTGSTFKALEVRGLIEVSGDWTTTVYIRLTTKGRKLAREALGVQTPRALKTGQLREWHWKALSLAYKAGEKGVPKEGIGYGRIGWNTWLRLRDYKINGVEYPLAVERNGMSITSFGKAYYERTFVSYHELYPDVPAPAPRTEIDPLEPFVEVVADHQACYACRGEYLIAVTRTYRQNLKGTWSVELHNQRTPGRVTSPYREFEQCVCQEGEIQEICAPLSSLLDQFIAEGWQLQFPHHHWYSSLDYLIGGASAEREKRWYEPHLVREKLRPLQELTNGDERNIMKDAHLHYYVNEHVGRGGLYTARGQFNPWPVVLTRRVERAGLEGLKEKTDASN